MKLTKRPGSKTLVILALALTLAAAWAASAQPQGDSQWPARLRIVYLPIFGKAETLKRFAPLTEQLQKTLETPVEAVSFDTYPEVVKALADNNYDIAYLSPAVYIEAAKLTKIQVLAMELDEEGRRGYYSVIISRADGSIKTLEDGRGKVLAFTNQESTSGFLAPLAHFMVDLKEPPASFAKEVVFAGDHRTVIMGVHEGKYDLGATGTVDFERTITAEKLDPAEFRTLWQSELIPGPPVCARADLPPNLKAAIAGALLLFNRDPQAVKALKIGGFAAATDQDYEAVKKYTALTP